MATTSTHLLRDVAWGDSYSGSLQHSRRPLKKSQRSKMNKNFGFLSFLNGMDEQTNVDTGSHQEDASDRSYMSLALERIEQEANYEVSRDAKTPYGFFNGRPIIGEATRINGGIYLGATPQEALVIDDKYGKLKQFYQDFFLNFVQCHGMKVEEGLLFQTLDRFIRSRMQFDESAVIAFLERQDISSDKKIALDLFLDQKLGGNRHFVMLAAYLVERLKDKGHLDGCLYISFVKKNEHTWVEQLTFTSATGKAYHFCPAKSQYF